MPRHLTSKPPKVRGRLPVIRLTAGASECCVRRWISSPSGWKRSEAAHSYFPAMSSLRMRHRAQFAGFIEPCLPSLADKPPSGGDWIHEIKLDGYRLMARRDGRGVRLFTRRGNNWTSQFPAGRRGDSRLKCRTCMIDGEVVAPGPDGVPSFELLRRKHPAVLYAFDLIELDGVDLRREPIETRKALWRPSLRSAGLERGIMLNDHMEGEAREIFEHACRLGFEGIVSKRRGSRYESGRSRHWIKLKNPESAAAKREAEEDWN